jgi:hypothetical protein
MNKIDAPSKYGLAAARNAELHANPAPRNKGKIGRQQLDAARTLPMARMLASAAVPAGGITGCAGGVFTHRL